MLQGCAHIANRETALLELHGIQPQAKGQATAPRKGNVSDAGHPLEPIAHHLVNPAAQEGVAVLLGIGAETQHHQQIVGAAAYLHAKTGHLGRQLAANDGDFVLGVDLVQLRIAAFKAEGDGAAVGGAGGTDGVEPFEPIQLFFQQGCHPLLHHLRAGAGVVGPHRDAARGDRGQVLHLQQGQAHQTP